MKELSYLNKYFFKYKYYLLMGFFFTAISNIFGIIPAQIVRHSIEIVQKNIGIYRLVKQSSKQIEFYHFFTNLVAIQGLLILAMAILKGLFLFAVRQSIIVMSRHIEYDLKNEIYAHYQTLSQNFYKQNRIGDLMARISEDVNKVRVYIGPSIMYLMNMVILLSLVLTYMFSVNSTLTWAIIIPMPILSASIFFVSSQMNKRSEQIQKSLSRLSSFVQEAYSGIRIIKSMAKENEYIKAFSLESNIYREKSLKLNKVDSLFSPFVLFLIGFCTVICVYVGGKEVIAGRLGLANITEYIMYIFMLTWPLTALGWTSSQIQRAAASQKRINEFLLTKNEIVSIKNAKWTIEGNMNFKNVSYKYPETGIEALKNITFSLKKGVSLAIIGSTGSGKSTIANLILRLFDLNFGEITFDSNNIVDFDVAHLRSQIAYVPQDVFLFSDTIFNNIAFGKPNATFEMVVEAAKKAKVHDNIIAFEQGYQTLIGERGITLSGGQKQRISIARALLKAPQILILDDCLSAVDTKTEFEILHEIKEFMPNKSTVLVSHRVSNARWADKIIILDEGEIVEMGSHEELLLKNNYYLNLLEKQNSHDDSKKLV